MIKYWGEPPKELKFQKTFVRNWFSNFEICNTVIDGKVYKTIEHYFQSQKSSDPKEQEKIRLASNASEAKKLGRKCKLREDWEEVKFDVMVKGLSHKFAPGTDNLNRLLKEPDGDVVEWNNWGDQVWGATLDGYGENKMGIILTLIKKLHKKDEN